MDESENLRNLENEEKYVFEYCEENPFKYAEEQNTIYNPYTDQFLYGINSNMRASGVGDGTCNQLNPWIFEQNNACGVGAAGGNPCKLRNNKLANYFDKENMLQNLKDKMEGKINKKEMTIKMMNSLNSRNLFRTPEPVTPGRKIPSYQRRMNDMFDGKDVVAANTFNKDMGINEAVNGAFFTFNDDEDDNTNSAGLIEDFDQITNFNENFINGMDSEINGVNISFTVKIIVLLLLIIIIYRLFNNKELSM